MAKRPVPKYDFKAFGAAIKAAREGRKESRKKVGDEMFILPALTLRTLRTRGSTQVYRYSLSWYSVTIYPYLITSSFGTTIENWYEWMFEHEELTEKEIGQFVNELSEVSLDSFTEAFEMASRKIQEYPHCDLLIYDRRKLFWTDLWLCQILMTKNEWNISQRYWSGWNEQQIVRMKEWEIQAFLYLQQNMSKWEIWRSKCLFLKKIPDTVIDATIMKTSVLAK